jgi:DNA topoisomerase VI subunit B
MSAPSLSRHVFKTSRLAEFCSKKVLVNQTGHAAEDWPVVVLQELLDNGLDAGEEAGIAPAIEIVVSGVGCKSRKGPQELVKFLCARVWSGMSRARAITWADYVIWGISGSLCR